MGWKLKTHDLEVVKVVNLFSDSIDPRTQKVTASASQGYSDVAITLLALVEVHGHKVISEVM